jgi:hypothetical protein
MDTSPPNSEQAVVFLHVLKTAGTTLHRIIERQYRPEQTYSVGLVEGESLAGLAELSETRRAKIRMLRGHMGFGVHRFLPGPSTYVTILRDPVERVISYYYFVLRTPDHYFHHALTSGDVGLKAFIRDKMHVMADNAQTRTISGVWQKPGFGECTQQTLETAKRHLRQHFAIVGLTERFDETLLLLRRGFRWRNVFYTRHNVTSDRPRRDELSPSTLDALVEANRLDIELYRYAAELFEGQVRQQGPSFAGEVRRFQLANRWVSLPMWGYWQVRKISVRAIVRRWMDRRSAERITL